MAYANSVEIKCKIKCAFGPKLSAHSDAMLKKNINISNNNKNMLHIIKCNVILQLKKIVFNDRLKGVADGNRYNGT
jgi:hypothetical protein